VEPARQALTELASDFETARWDLYEVMGGRGAMQYWVEAELGYVDYIHFTQLGYELQADLLYTALMKAYHEYR
jgi:lysophospholipase L1-like esterase